MKYARERTSRGYTSIDSEFTEAKAILLKMGYSCIEIKRTSPTEERKIKGKTSAQATY